MLDSFERSMRRKNGATIFCYPVKNPKDYGVIEFSKDNKVIRIVEKPENPISKFAITGIYFLTQPLLLELRKLNYQIEENTKLQV